MPLVNVVQPSWIKHLREEVHRDALIPRCIDLPVGLERLVVLLANNDVVVAVPEKIGGHGAAPDVLIVDEHERLRRRGSDPELLP